MKNTIEAQKNEPSMQRLIKNIINSAFGPTEQLPLEVLNRIQEVYTRFIPAYVEIIRIKENLPSSWQPERLSIDAEIVEDMMHFFSDYQHIARDFKTVNDRVNALLRLDRQKNPKQYDEWLDHIVSKTSQKKIMSSIVEASSAKN